MELSGSEPVRNISRVSVSLAPASPALIALSGEESLRPLGLERSLLRAGFQVAEVSEGGALPTGEVRAIVHLARSRGGAPLADLLPACRVAEGTWVPLLLLVTEGVPDDLVRAAEAGADDALLLPATDAEVVARLRARLVLPRPHVEAVHSEDLRLFGVLQSVAAELNRDEMLHALVQTLAQQLELRSVSCLLHHGEAVTGRLLAASDAPKVRDAEIELARWPEAVAAHERGATVHLNDVATSPLFRAVGPRVAGGGPAADLEATAAIPLQSMGRSFGTVVLRSRRGEAPISRSDVAFAELAVHATSRLIDTDDRRGAIARRQALAAHVDPLTGCGTLDALDRRIREEFERSRRYRAAFALVLLDVDGMRLINDRIGRDAGHRVLADLGRLLQRELRGPDFVARYGGEEFLLLLPETDLEGGRQTVHRIRERLQQQISPVDAASGIRCRLTAGIAVYPHPAVHKPEDLFAIVEAAMLAGKSQDVERIGFAAA